MDFERVKFVKVLLPVFVANYIRQTVIVLVNEHRPKPYYILLLFIRSDIVQVYVADAKGFKVQLKVLVVVVRAIQPKIEVLKLLPRFLVESLS